MTGRSLHDTLLRVLSHGPIRAQLIDTDGKPPTFGVDEWQILRRVPKDSLRNMARFLTRHYYGERIVRLFRHIRRLASQTGRDPLLILDTPRVRAVLDQAVLGSPDTADEMASLIKTFLLVDTAEIQQRFPYWQDLVHYQATMFGVEARRAKGSGTRLPCRSPSGNVVQFEWDLPAILPDLAPLNDQQATRLHRPSRMLIASSADRHVTSVRCTLHVQRLLEAADGTRTVEELGIMADLSVRQTEQALELMKQIGAIQWKAGITET
jgi:hypothetical protein